MADGREFNMKTKHSKIYTVLTIAGSDPIGGAGIQADIKTISTFGLYGISVITAITAQNTQGVQSVHPIAPEIVAEQLDSVFTDIMPDCVKLGMLANKDIVEVVAEKLKQYMPKRIVIDPIMASSSGRELLNKEGRRAMVEKLFPLAMVVTPNLPEAQILMEMSGQKGFVKIEKQIEVCSAQFLENKGKQNRKKMAEAISLFFGNTVSKEQAVLIKGGHMQGQEAEDYLYCISYDNNYDNDNQCNIDSIIAQQMEERKIMEFSFVSPRIDNPNTHGTGCTLSSAIACGLAVGKTVEDSVRLAKEYMTGAILGGLSIGKGIGPLDHFWKMTI